MGMSYLEYARLTLANFELKLEGFERQQYKEDVRVRKLCFYSIAPYLNKDSADCPNSEYDLYELAGDPKKKRAKKGGGSSEFYSTLKMYEKQGLIKDGKIIHNPN
jgi:hypothetical protein